MTDLKYNWPLSVESMLLSPPLLLTYTSYSTTAHHIINSEDDLVDHMIHYAKVLVDNGLHSSYGKWNFEAFFQERMGFSFGFYTDVFSGKPNKAMVKVQRYLCKMHIRLTLSMLMNACSFVKS